MTKNTKSYAEKEKEVKELTIAIEERLKKVFVSKEDLTAYLTFVSKFYRYSSGNNLLIQLQFQGAEAVGSFAYWKKKGYSVKKGEKGIKILVPNKLRPKFQDDGKWKLLSEATEEQKEKVQQGELKLTKGKTSYSIGHVYDASQTNMKAEDLPKVFPNKWLEGNVKNYSLMFEGMNDIAKAINVQIIEPKSELGVAKGVSYPFTKEVALNPRNSELQNVKTLLHELAHAKLHTRETRDNYTAAEKEFQAEMVAFTICTHVGIDTSDYSLSYLHNWTKGKELEDHKKLLKEIRETSVQFIDVLDQVLENEKTVEHTQEHQQSQPDLKEKEKQPDDVTKKADVQLATKNQVTQEEIDHAMKVDLLEYLQSKGETFVRQGQYHRHTKHDSLVIKDNMYAWNSQNEKGKNSIVFARLFYGMSFVEAVQDLNGSGVLTTSSKPKAQKEPFSYEKNVIESDTTVNLERYLTRDRGISSHVVKQLIQDGYVVEDEKKNIVFKWKSHEEEIVGCDRQGTIRMNNPNYKHSTFKKIEANSKEDYGFNVTLGLPKKLYFFESPIDLASYWSLKKSSLNDCRLISMNGLKPKTVINFIRTHNQKMKMPLEQMILCVDNDKAGKEFIEKMEGILNKERLKIEHPKVCKDWNEVLMMANKRKKKKQMSR